MKINIKTYFHALLATAMAVTVTACDENAWNNQLDGFEDKVDAPFANQQSVEYTLSNAEYSTIASLADNTAIAEAAGASDALAAVGTLKRFSADAPAATYIPAFLASTNFPYFTLTEGSSVKMTYNVAEDEPAEYVEAQTVQSFKVSSDMYYNDVWGDDNYVEAFCPSMPAEDYLPDLLSDYADPSNGNYCIVSYNLATQEPVFGGGSSQPEPEEPFALSSTIGTVANGDTGVKINGYVSAICGQGYILTDASGSIFVYMGSSFGSAPTVSVGQQLKVTGDIGQYNTGLQVTGSTASVEVAGEQAVTYPAAKVYTGAELDQIITRTESELAVYATVTGTVTITDRNINVAPAGAETAQGSVYGITEAIKALFTDGAEQTITGYFIAVAGGRYCNFVITEVDGAAVKALSLRAASRGAAYVPTVVVNEAYYYNGSKWAPAKGFVTLSPADYTAMGQSYSNLPTAEPYLSKYLNINFPYAAEGDSKYIYWTQYASGTSTVVCSAYEFDGTTWAQNTFTTTETNQFVINAGKWIYDPNVTIDLPNGKGNEISTTYYQACVNWVYENIDKPLGSDNIKSGKFYVSSYGNNEYYSGTSAYYGNVDIRGDKAIEQYADGYAGMTEEQATELMKQRFMNEVMPGALAILHPDAKPLDGLDVLYTINFAVYTGSTTIETAVFKVVGEGKFEPVSCTWDAAE